MNVVFQSPILHLEKLLIYNWECEAGLKVSTRRPWTIDHPDEGGPFISPVGCWSAVERTSWSHLF